jgi:hypothetical protein
MLRKIDRRVPGPAVRILGGTIIAKSSDESGMVVIESDGG